MARFDRLLRRKKKSKQLQLVYIMVSVLTVMYFTWKMSTTVVRSIQLVQHNKSKKKLRQEMLSKLIRESDGSCRKELGVNRHTFNVLCEMLRDIGGLHGTRNMSTEEIASMFLYTLVHNEKNRYIGKYFMRSGESVSRQFNICLRAVLKLHQHLLKKPTLVSDECEDDGWRCFKNCLGALGNAYIDVSVSSQERRKYRTTTGSISLNVLGACTPELEFIYVLSGWEGSAGNDIVLQNAITRPNGLKLPQGGYYLVDNGYSNYEGFLAPYSGYHYRVKALGAQQPQCAEECFNMRHAKARSVIGKCFRLLKGRWGILRSPSSFPIQTQGRIVMACCLLHNLIRRYMPMDHIEDGVFLNEDYDEDDGCGDDGEDDDGGGDDEIEFSTVNGAADYWTSFRDQLAQKMFELQTEA
ncbi:hypothetical protein V2J09_014767 [Rumex salicifolius]